MIKEINKYIGQVADEKEKTSTYFKLQCQRHLNDLNKLDQDQFRFNGEEAMRHVNFMLKVARHTKDRWAGKLFQAQPFQLAMISLLFGWEMLSEDTGGWVRRFNTLLFDIARKNGKTETVATIANDILTERRYGTEIYCCATSRDQAMTTFKAAANQMRFMQKSSLSLRKRFNVKKFEIENVNEDGLLKPLSSDHNTLDSLSPLVAIIDEYHAHKNSRVYDVMESGQGSRWDGPIMAVTTTAGFNKESPCYQFRENAIEVLRGNRVDNSLLPIIFSMDEDDDWKDESLWYKSNPNLGVSLSLEFLRKRMQKAINEGPTKQREFKTKNLNLWVDADETWIEKDVWKENAKLTGIKHYEKLNGRKCYGAIDLSSVRDLTCLALVFPVQPGLDRVHIITYHFCPAARVRQMQSKGFHHATWVNNKWISATEGNVIDYEAIKQTIVDCKSKYKFKELAYDRWGAQHIVDAVAKTGLKFVPHGQGFGDMNEPAKAFEKAVYDKKTPIEHFNNPVLTWEIGNTVVKTDPAGNIKPDKKNASGQIDGVVASIMAYGLMIKRETNKSPYATRGLRTIG